MRYATINNPENEKKKKKKKEKKRKERVRGERERIYIYIYIYDLYTNEIVRKTRCAIQNRTDNLYNLKMNKQWDQL